MNITDIEEALARRPNLWWEALLLVVPELEPMARTLQSPIYHQEGDVATHTRMAIAVCPEGCDPDLLWAVLLHDIGKPATTTEHNGKITAYKHDHVGASIAMKVLMRLKMPENRLDKIVWLIKNHNFYHSWQLTSCEQVSQKHLSVINDPRFPLLLELVRVDSLASKGTKKSDYYKFYKNIWTENQ